MDDRVPSPPPHSDKLKPLFTHEPLSRRDPPKEDPRQSQETSPNASQSPVGAALQPSHGSRASPSTLSVPAPALVQPAVEGSATQNRPSNSWLRYRRLKQVELAHLGLKMGELSKVIAKMWREEPQEIKDFHKTQCQEQWASDRANGYQYRQPKMPLPGEPRAKKGRSGPWRKTQRPLLDLGSAPPAEVGVGGQVNPIWAPAQLPVDHEETVGPETNSVTRLPSSGNPYAGGSRRSPDAVPSRFVSDSGGIHEVALHHNRTLHPSTLSSSTSSSVYRPDDGVSPPLLALEHKHEPTEFEFSPPRSEYDMDVDAGVPLAPIVTSAGQSPLSDAASSPAPAAPRGITLPSLRQDPILGRALELPPVHDYFTVCCVIVNKNLA